MYDDDGNRLAIKLFQQDEGNINNDNDSTDSSVASSCEENQFQSMDIGALREISILRLLRGASSHRNIIQIHDFKQRDDLEEEQDYGNDIMSNMGLVMPFYTHGNLTDAIDSNQISNKKLKVTMAHGILSAVAFLHANGIIHRDIKGDNIMLDFDDETGDFFPVLIDFSLAKVIQPQMYLRNSHAATLRKIKTLSSDIVDEDTHTAEVGTPTYRSPEVVSGEPYNLASDMYSVGVVLLEILRGKCLEATKDKSSMKLIQSEIGQLPDQPFANLVRGLLEADPLKRLSASAALESDLFKKFGLSGKEALRSIDMMDALPFDNDDENKPPSNSNITKDKVLLKRIKVIRRIIHELGCENPLTMQAAFMYSQQLSQLDDCDDSSSQAIFDCVVLAHKFFEKEIWSLREIEKINSGIFKDFEWSADQYCDTEATLLMLLDFCLYPRQIVLLEP